MKDCIPRSYPSAGVSGPHPAGPLRVGPHAPALRRPKTDFVFKRIRRHRGAQGPPGCPAGGPPPPRRGPQHRGALLPPAGAGPGGGGAEISVVDVKVRDRRRVTYVQYAFMELPRTGQEHAPQGIVEPWAGFFGETRSLSAVPPAAPTPADAPSTPPALAASWRPNGRPTSAPAWPSRTPEAPSPSPSGRLGRRAEQQDVRRGERRATESLVRRQPPRTGRRCSSSWPTAGGRRARSSARGSKRRPNPPGSPGGSAAPCVRPPSPSSSPADHSTAQASADRTEKTRSNRSLSGLWGFAGIWSGRQDSNLRPPEPHSGALPGCATPRTSWLL
jgi:hypothetical protein